MSEHDPITGEITPHPVTHRWSVPANEIFAALAKAQANIKTAPKDSTNPHFKSRYADLAAVRGACWEALTAAGIAVVQMPINSGPNIGVVTVLGHSSGQWIEGTVWVQPTKFDAQGVGSVITYLRRYSLAAMAGVAPDDDDGEAAVGRPAAAEVRTAPPNANGARQYPGRQQAAPAPSEAAAQAKLKVRQMMGDIDAMESAEMLGDLERWMAWEQLDKLLAEAVPADRAATLDMLRTRAANRRRKLLGSDGLEAFDGR